MANEPTIAVKLTLKGLESVRSGLQKVAATAKASAVKVAQIGTVGATAFGGFVAWAATADEELKKMAIRAGLTVEQFSELVYAGRLFGAEAEDMASGLATLAERITEAGVLGESTATEAFQMMGLSARDANGELRNAYDLMYDMATWFEKTSDNAVKTKVAFDIFSDDARFIMPLLNEGAEAMGKMADRARKSRSIVSEEDAQIALRLKIELNRLWYTLQRIGIEVARVFMPNLMRTSDALSRWLEDSVDGAVAAAERFRDWTESMMSDIKRILSGDTVKVENVWLKDFAGILRSAWQFAVDLLAVLGGRLNDVKIGWLRELVPILTEARKASWEMLKALFGSEKNAEGLGSAATFIKEQLKAVRDLMDGEVKDNWITRIYGLFVLAWQAAKRFLNVLIPAEDAAAGAAKGTQSAFQWVTSELGKILAGLAGTGQGGWQGALGDGIEWALEQVTKFIGDVARILGGEDAVHFAWMNGLRDDMDEMIVYAENFWDVLSGAKKAEGDLAGLKWVQELRADVLLLKSDIEAFFNALDTILSGKQTGGRWSWMNDIKDGFESIVSSLKTAAELFGEINAAGNKAESFVKPLLFDNPLSPWGYVFGDDKPAQPNLGVAKAPLQTTTKTVSVELKTETGTYPMMTDAKTADGFVRDVQRQSRSGIGSGHRMMGGR